MTLSHVLGLIFYVTIALVLVGVIVRQRREINSKVSKEFVDKLSKENFNLRLAVKEAKLTGPSQKITFAPEPIKIYIPKTLLMHMSPEEYKDFMSRMEFYLTRNLSNYDVISEHNIELDRYEITIRPTKG